MANRLTDTTIWKKQKWFKKLPVLYKLAWKYMTDECNHVGIWKIDMSELLDDLGIEDFDLDDFKNSCNKDYDKKTGSKINRQRIMQINDNYLWLTGFLTFQYGNKAGLINSKNNTIKTIVETLQTFDLLSFGLNNGYFSFDIPIEEVRGYKGLEGALTPSKGLEGGQRGNSKGIGNSIGISTDNNTLAIDNTKLWFLKFYHSTYDDYKNVYNGQSTTPEMFATWKSFIDFIYKNKYEELFECKFINPQDFAKLTDDGFVADIWDATIKSLLSTGIKPEHNLYFRIPTFMSIALKGKAIPTKEFTEQQKKLEKYKGLKES